MRTYKQKLQNNLWKVYAFKILRKRVYWPVLVIYILGVAGVTPEEFGLIVGLGALCGLVLEIPSGYISDKFGHKRTLVLSYFIYLLAPITYILFPSFWGVLVATMFFVASIAFQSGTFSAFFHETLIELGRPDDYTKIMTRAQSVSLFVNAALLASIPFLYPINPKLPFVVGAVLLFINLIIAMTLTQPQKIQESVAELEDISFMNLVKSIRSTKQYFVFFVIGLSGGLFAHAGKFREIYLQDIGIPVEYLGLILALSSVFAGLLGFVIHRMEHIKEKTFYLVDFGILFICLLAISFIHNPVFGALFFIIQIMYLRHRAQLINGHMLRRSPSRELKATYMSMIEFLSSLNGVWVPILLGYLVGSFGTHIGYRYFILVAGGGFFIVYSMYLIQQKRADTL